MKFFSFPLHRPVFICRMYFVAPVQSEMDWIGISKWRIAYVQAIFFSKSLVGNQMASWPIPVNGRNVDVCTVSQYQNLQRTERFTKFFLLNIRSNPTAIPLISVTNFSIYLLICLINTRQPKKRKSMSAMLSEMKSMGSLRILDIPFCFYHAIWDFCYRFIIKLPDRPTILLLQLWQSVHIQHIYYCFISYPIHWIWKFVIEKKKTFISVIVQIIFFTIVISSL